MFQNAIGDFYILIKPFRLNSYFPLLIINEILRWYYYYEVLLIFYC